MAHFARVMENGLVIKVITCESEDIDNLQNDGINASWVQTSYNTNAGVHYNPETGEPSADQSLALRKNFAMIGGTYDSDRDAFIPIKPSEYFVLNETTCQWEPPYPAPDETSGYVWSDEDYDPDVEGSGWVAQQR